MDEAPNLFSYDGVHGGGDDGYRLFDGQNVAGQGDCRQDSLSANYTDAFPFDASTQDRPSGSMSTPSVPDPKPAMSAEGTITSGNGRRHLALSHSDSAKLESPGLSSGSSATPDTRASQQMITPDDPPLQPDIKPQHVTEASGFPPPASPPKKKRERKPKEKEEVEPPKEEVKRTKFLERNRVAATKCRQKKKEWVSDLEETKFALESQNNHLQMEYSGLADEVGEIKAQLMSHANCNDPKINKWIENEAKKFVMGAGERHSQLLVDTGPTPHAGLDPQQGIVSSTSGYPVGTSDLVSPATTSSHGGSTSLPQDNMITNLPVFYRPNMAPNMPPNMPPNMTGNPVKAESILQEELMQSSGEHDGTDFDGMPMAGDTFRDSTIA